MKMASLNDQHDTKRQRTGMNTSVGTATGTATGAQQALPSVDDDVEMVNGSDNTVTQNNVTYALVRSKASNEEAISFLTLPAEIRNKIYDLCLVTPTGVHIRARAPRGTPNQLTYTCGTSPQDGNEPRNGYLCPNILATCKQVHQEAINLLYDQELHFHPDKCFVHLGTFLSYLGDDMLKKLQVIHIPGWYFLAANRGGTNSAVFALLRGATNLKKVTIAESTFVPYLDRPLGIMARRFFPRRPPVHGWGAIRFARMLGRAMAHKVYGDAHVWINHIVRFQGIEKLREILFVSPDSMWVSAHDLSDAQVGTLSTIWPGFREPGLWPVNRYNAAMDSMFNEFDRLARL